MTTHQLFFLRDALEKVGQLNKDGRFHIFNSLHVGDIYVRQSRISAAFFDGSIHGEAAVRCLLPLEDATWIWHEGITAPSPGLQIPIATLLLDFEKKQTEIEDSQVTRGRLKDDTRALPKLHSNEEADSKLTVHWRLVHVASGQSVELAQASSVIGRQEDCDVAIADDSLSRKHCRLNVIGRGILLTDLGSTNGTFVRGYSVTEGIIGDGDEFKLGDVAFRCEQVN